MCLGWLWFYRSTALLSVIEKCGGISHFFLLRYVASGAREHLRWPTSSLTTLLPLLLLLLPFLSCRTTTTSFSAVFACCVNKCDVMRDCTFGEGATSQRLSVEPNATRQSSSSQYE